MGTCSHEWPSSTDQCCSGQTCCAWSLVRTRALGRHVSKTVVFARPRSPRPRPPAGTPSRASLQTGRYPIRTGCMGNVERYRAVLALAQSIYTSKAFLLRSCTCGANGNAPVFLSRALVLLPAPGRAHDPRRHTHPGQPRRARPRQRDEPGGGAPGPTLWIPWPEPEPAPDHSRAEKRVKRSFSCVPQGRTRLD